MPEPKQDESKPLKKNEVKAVTVSLEMDGQAILFVLLADDGTINRMGSATEDCVNDEVVIGVTQEALFADFMSHVDEEMLAHSGAFENPGITGRKCMVSIFFTGQSEDQKAAFQFTYGSESAGPPRMIGNLVMKAIDITQPWYEAQKAKPTVEIKPQDGKN